MNDAIGQRAKGPRLVTFDRTSAFDVIEKLRRDIARIDSSTEWTIARDHTVSAFWTAWHIHQWLWDVISKKPELKSALLSYRGIDNDQIEDSVAFGTALAQRFVPLKICRMIATSPNYVRGFLPATVKATSRLESRMPKGIALVQAILPMDPLGWSQWCSSWAGR